MYQAVSQNTITDVQASIYGLPSDAQLLLTIDVNGTQYTSQPFSREFLIFNWYELAGGGAGGCITFNRADFNAPGDFAGICWEVDALGAYRLQVNLSMPFAIVQLVAANTDFDYLMNFGAVEFVEDAVPPDDPDDPDDPEVSMSALEALQQIWDKTQSFYGVCFVDELSAEEMAEVTDWCQSHYRLPFFVVTDSADAIATTTAINQLNYYTHVTTYHQSHDEVGAIMGMALDQKFDQPNGIKTLKFKTLVGTPPTPIGETLAGQLDAAGVNYYTSYGNPDAPVLMYSQSFAGAGKFADFVMGLHWLRNDAQVEVFNTFRINPKVSQTEGGMSVLKAAVARSCMRGVDNGLIAGGQWNGQPLGTVNTGDFLPTGYYIYADKIRNQTQQVRETRQAQPISVLVKGAGALHGADISFIGEQ